MSDIAPMIGRVIAREGGYSDNPQDAGGCTNYGITLATLRSYQNNPALTCEDVRALTAEQAATIYRKRYLEPFTGVSNQGLLELLFDSAVQHGARAAIQWLQGAVGVHQDGVIGPLTLAAVEAHDPRETFAAIYRARLLHYAAIVVERPDQVTFLSGWLSRMGGLLSICLKELYA